MQRERASAIVVDRGELLCVRLRDPRTHIARLFPPGGGPEPGEAWPQVAEREALEETGYRVVVDPALCIVERYPYTWNGIEIDVTTHFFGARLAGTRAEQGPVEDASFHEGVVWLPLSRVADELAYEPVIRRAVAELAARVGP